MTLRLLYQSFQLRSIRQIASRFAHLLHKLSTPTRPPLLASPSNAPLTMSTPSPTPRRISHVTLLLATVILLFVAEFSIPGGLTPRRTKQHVLAKRVVEHLDIISRTDPNVILPGGPLPIEQVHRNAIVHRGAWMFALDSHLRLLLSWRAPVMMTCPMTWSTIGEHSISNETFEQTARRGVLEEARFIARPRIYPIGLPFFFHHVYENGTDDERTDNQWTQAFVVLPRGDALDFRTLDDREALTDVASETSRYQGMALPDVLKHMLEQPEYFCNDAQVKWMQQLLPLVVRVLKQRDKRLYRSYLQERWGALVDSGAAVCCNASEHSKNAEEVNVSSCGVPCGQSTDDMLSEVER